MNRKRSKEADKFIGSLILLIGALIIAFVVLAPRSQRAPTVTPNMDVMAELDEKRRSMRRASVLAKPQTPGDDAFMTIEPPREAQKSVEGVGAADVAATEKSQPPPLAPGAVDPDIQKAVQQVDAGNIHEAVTLLEGVLQRDPTNEQALVELAMINLLDLKQPDAAVRYLEKVVDVNPHNRIVLTELISLYDEQGNAEGGMAYLMNLQAKYPDSPDVAYGIGQMLVTQGRSDEAIAYLEKASKTSEGRSQVLTNLAQTYAQTGQSQKATESYREAIEQFETEIGTRKKQGLPSTFDEERLGYLKIDYARELIRQGHYDEARDIVMEIEGHIPGDQNLMSLKEQLKGKGAG